LPRRHDFSCSTNLAAHPFPCRSVGWSSAPFSALQADNPFSQLRYDLFANGNYAKQLNRYGINLQHGFSPLTSARKPIH